jgi:phospholipase C
MPRSVRSLVPALWLLGLALLAAISLACGGGRFQTPVPADQPTFAHVVIVVEENHGFSDVIGNSTMPYINGLAQQYGLAAQYFANVHPSLANYFVLTAGEIPAGVQSGSFSGTVTDDNISRELAHSGVSWKCYAESIPSAGYLGPDVYPYHQDHNPFAFFSDIQHNPQQRANIVPFSQFGSDLGANSIPQFSFIVPNVLDDAHDGTLPQADAWLQHNIDPLLHSPSFQAGGLLIITFDEAEDSDTTNGGGHVATVIVSTKSKRNYVSQTFFQHQSTLRLALASLKVDHFPGAAASAPDMTEFFTGP